MQPKTYNKSHEALKLLSTDHYFCPVEMERQKNQLPYFCPPWFAFLPSTVRSTEDSRLTWSYAFWHELRHLEQILQCSLGFYLTALDDLSESLMIFGVNRIMGQDDGEGKQCIAKSLEILQKVKLLSISGTTVGEISPTCSQLHPDIRLRTAQLIYENVASRFFVKKGPTLDEVRNFTAEVGDIWVTNLRAPVDERIASVTEAHEKAYLYGERILEQFGDERFIHAVPLFSLYIDLSDVDLLSISAKDLQWTLGDCPDRYNPEYRLESALRDRITSEEMRQSIARINTKLQGLELRLNTSESLPRCFTEASRSLVEGRIKYIASKMNVQAGHVSHDLFADQNVEVLSTKSAELFFRVPVFITDSEEFIRNTLLNAYTYETVLRCFGLSKYRDDLLMTMEALIRRYVPNIGAGHNVIRRALSQYFQLRS